MSKNSAKSLAKTAVLDASDKPEDQDEARKRRVKMDFASWRKQTKAGKTTHQEEVGISSAAAMEKARREALLRKKEEEAVKKEKEALKKEEVQVDEVYKKLPVAKMASKISKKQFKAGQSGDVGTISKKSTETGKMIGVIDTHDPERSKAKSKIKEAKVDQGLDDEGKEDARNYRRFGTRHNQHKTAVLRRSLERSKRGEKKVKGRKEPANAYGEEKVGWDRISKIMESATNPEKFSMKKFAQGLEKKHGKGSVISKYTEGPKPPTEAQKKAAAKRRAEIASQDKRDQREKETQGRYSSKYSNVGSD